MPLIAEGTGGVRSITCIWDATIGLLQLESVGRQVVSECGKEFKDFFDPSKVMPTEYPAPRQHAMEPIPPIPANLATIKVEDMTNVQLEQHLAWQREVELTTTANKELAKINVQRKAKSVENRDRAFAIVYGMSHPSVIAAVQAVPAGHKALQDVDFKGMVTTMRQVIEQSNATDGTERREKALTSYEKFERGPPGDAMLAWLGGWLIGWLAGSDMCAFHFSCTYKLSGLLYFSTSLFLGALRIQPTNQRNQPLNHDLTARRDNILFLKY